MKLIESDSKDYKRFYFR